MQFFLKIFHVDFEVIHFANKPLTQTLYWTVNKPTSDTSFISSQIWQNQIDEKEQD